MNWRIPFSSLKTMSPVMMAFLMGVGTFVVMFIMKFASDAQDAPWEMAMSGLLLYSWLVTVVAFFTEKWGRFTILSILSFFAMLVLLCLAAYFLSGLSIFDVRAYQLFISAMVLFFAVAIVVGRALRGLSRFIESN